MAQVEIPTGADVLLPAVGQGLKEPGPAPGPDLPRRRLDAVVEVQDIVVLDPLGGQAVSASPVADRRRSLPKALVGVDGVEVIFANEKDGKAFEHGKVEAFSEGPLL